MMSCFTRLAMEIIVWFIRKLNHKALVNRRAYKTSLVCFVSGLYRMFTIDVNANRYAIYDLSPVNQNGNGL